MTQEVLGKDISMDNADIQFSLSQDFRFSTYRKNLAQAIEHRLRTVKGEYYNTEYGSEIHRCFGKPKTNLLLSQLKGYIVECLKQEPRIADINELNLEFDRTRKDQVNVTISVIPIDEQVELNLIFPLFL